MRISQLLHLHPSRWAGGGEEFEVDSKGWATHYIPRLQAGETVQFRLRGDSMSGCIESGSLCNIAPADPADPSELAVGDIVLCKVRGAQYLHLIKAIRGGRFQIGNNRGRINGWIKAASIYGKCVRVEA